MTDDAVVDEGRIEELLGRLSVEEKVSLLAGRDVWHLPAIERIGLGELKMSDGPAGVRGESTTGGPTSLNVPCGSALAATWEPGLIEMVGRELGREARRKGVHVLLAPTVNLHRTPTGGRNFECMSEDPFLTARLAAAYVRGVQSEGVAACTKHLVANDSETERFTVSSEVDERTLRELYLVPFEAALREAGSWSVMGAYNKLWGTHCCEHPWLLTDLLADEWGWDGVVVSDWLATHSTTGAVDAGLDVEMPGPALERGPKLVAALESGEVSAEVLDERVRRVLRLAVRTGALGDEGAPPERRAEQAGAGAGARDLGLSAAAAGIVLLRNEAPDGGDRPLLPLDAAAGGTIAVIGPNADAATVQGGGSAQVATERVATVLDGMRARFAAAEVCHEPGVVTPRGTAALDLRRVRTPEGELGGFLVEHVGDTEAEGPAVLRQVGRRSRLVWWGAPRGLDVERWSLRFTGDYLPLHTGRHRFEFRAAARIRVRVDGDLVVDQWDARGVGRHPVEVDCVAGEPVRIEVALVPGGTPLEMVGLDVRCVEPLPDDLLERAVAVASRSDLAVVVVGMDSEWETEGRDRDQFGLPPGQDELIEAVVAANPNTVVVVNAGSPVAMPWAERVPAIAWLWYPGQDGGHALAHVVAGDVDATGRLPVTIPHRLEDTPAFLHHPGERGQERYGEGVFIGYRWYDTRDLAPRYPFGFGLSYTRFSYGAAEAEVTAADLHRVVVRVPVTNVGERPGSEVVQLYVSDAEASVRRPAQELKAFHKIWLEPGETEVVELHLDTRSFAFWDVAAHGWTVEPGTFHLRVGSSSRDIRTTATIAL